MTHDNNDQVLPSEQSQELLVRVLSMEKLIQRYGAYRQVAKAYRIVGLLTGIAPGSPVPGGG